MSIDWTTIENALAAWIRAGTGIPADRVLWGDQSIERPTTGPWVSLRVIAIQRIGQDWADIEDASPSVPGAEINYVLRGCRAARLSVQCFSGTATGSSRAAALLDNCLLNLASPSRRSAFATAGIGIGDVGNIQDISAVIGTSRFEPRAALDVTLLLATESSGAATETGTIVETVAVTGTVE